jgi:hypothetical protein
MNSQDFRELPASNMPLGWRSPTYRDTFSSLDLCHEWLSLGAGLRSVAVSHHQDVAQEALPSSTLFINLHSKLPIPDVERFT